MVENRKYEDIAKECGLRNKKVQGGCTKEQCNSEEERTAICGCVFQCQNWGKGLGYFWTRVEDCPEHIEMIIKAVEDANQ